MWENGKFATMPPQAFENHFYPSHPVDLFFLGSTSYYTNVFCQVFLLKCHLKHNYLSQAH